MLRFGKMSFVLLIVVLALSCNKDSDDCNVGINITEPINGSSISDPSSVNVQIIFTGSSGNVNDLSIQVFPVDNPSDFIVNTSSKPNTRIHIENQLLDLSGYPSGSEFRIEAVGCCGPATCNFAPDKISVFTIP